MSPSRDPIYAAPYAGPVQVFTLDEVAVKLRMTRQWVDQNYDGPRVKLGRNTGVSAKHLDVWLDQLAGLEAVSARTRGKGRIDVG